MKESKRIKEELIRVLTEGLVYCEREQRPGNGNMRTNRCVFKTDFNGQSFKTAAYLLATSHKCLRLTSKETLTYCVFLGQKSRIYVAV